MFRTYFKLQGLSVQRTTSLGDRKLLLQALLIYRISVERVSKLSVGLEASSRTFHILAAYPCRFISIQSGATPVEYFNTVTPGNRIEFNRSIERALRAAIYDFTVALHSRFIRLWTAAGTYWDCQPILPVISTPVLTPDVSQTRKPVKLSTVSEEIKTSLQARDESSTKKIGPIVRRQRNVPRRRFHGELCFYI